MCLNLKENDNDQNFKLKIILLGREWQRVRR